MNKQPNRQTPYTLTAIPLSNVTLEDPFWSPKLKTLREITLPDVFDKFEREGAFGNFERVRDGLAGGHAGRPWYDGLIYETIRAGADVLAQYADPALDARLDGYIARIAAAAAADPNGYLNTYTQLEMPACHFGLNGGNLLWQHDIYNAGALIEAAVHHYLAMGKTSLLRIAVRFADHMADVMGPEPRQNIVPAHSMAEEAVLKLYQLFRAQPALRDSLGLLVEEQRYLELVEFWIEHRGNYEGRAPLSIPQCGPAYAQDHLPVMQQETAEGHSVRASLLYTGLITAAAINGRQDYYQAAVRLWDNVVERKLHIGGSVGSNAEYEGFGPDYFLPNDAYLETCAAVGMGFFHQAMALAFADARCVDELERALYNGVLTGVSLQGDTYFYENPLESEGRERWAWHDCPCCPPMLLKILAALGSYLYAQSEDSLYVSLYAGSTAQVMLGGVALRITQQTNYPWEGKVTLSLETPDTVSFALNLRVPGWCEGATVCINGQLAEAEVRNGYAHLARQWHDGDRVELSLLMPVRRVVAHPAVEATRGKVALQRGPIVYAVEGLDNGGSADVALADDPQLAHEHRAGFLGGVTVITGKTAQGGDLIAIPFYAIANREKTPMRVWLRQAGMPASADGKRWQDERALYRFWA